MKKSFLFLLMMLTFTMVAMAQNKRIVVIEPIDKEQNIPNSIVTMVRSNLTMVISSVSGYEGFDNVDMAEIMDSPGFDSVGLVEEDRIRLIGEVYEADYILVSEIVRYDESNIFVTAKILNAVTTITEGSENALMGMTAQNIQHGCESLVKKLLILMNRFNNMVQRPNKSIGEIVIFSDSSKGIVFYMDEEGRGLAVSLNEGKDVWDNSYRIQDVMSLNNLERGETIFNYGEGEHNTQAILASLGNKARAAFWCSLQGDGWYLPSCGELYVLMSVADENPAFIESLRSAAGGEIDGWYWSSTEYNDEEVWNVKIGGRCSTEEKEEELKVRAVKAFTIH